MRIGKPRYLWLKGFLAAGLVLSLLLLIQSVYTYGHVSRQLVSDQLVRDAERQVLAVERGLRLSAASNAEQQKVVLEDILRGRWGGTFTMCSPPIKITSQSCLVTWLGKVCLPRC